MFWFRQLQEFENAGIQPNFDAGGVVGQGIVWLKCSRMFLGNSWNTVVPKSVASLIA